MHTNVSIDNWNILGKNDLHHYNTCNKDSPKSNVIGVNIVSRYHCFKDFNVLERTVRNSASLPIFIKSFFLLFIIKFLLLYVFYFLFNYLLFFFHFFNFVVYMLWFKFSFGATFLKLVQFLFSFAVYSLP